MRCLSCKYDLSNLTEHRCPECGREFDLNDPRTFASTKKWDGWLHFSVGVGVLVLLLLAFFAWFAYQVWRGISC